MPTNTRTQEARRSRQKVDPEAWYSLVELTRGRMFPWIRGIRKYRATIHADKRAKDYLRAQIIGEGRGRKYYIKGENVERFRRKVEETEYRNRIQV